MPIICSRSTEMKFPCPHLLPKAQHEKSRNAGKRSRVSFFACIIRHFLLVNTNIVSQFVLYINTFARNGVFTFLVIAVTIRLSNINRYYVTIKKFTVLWRQCVKCHAMHQAVMKNTMCVPTKLKHMMQQFSHFEPMLTQKIRL